MSIWNKDFIILLVINTFTSFSSQILNPILPQYMQLQGIANASQTGILVAAYAFSGMAMRPFSGIAADRLDRKKIVILSQISAALIYLGMAFAPNYGSMLVLRIIYGLTHGITTTNAMASAMATLPSDKIGSGLGFYGISSIGSQAIAPAIGLAIRDEFGYPAVFAVTVVLLAVSSFIGLALKPQPKAATTKKPKISLNNMFAKEAVGQAIIGMIFMSGSVAINNFLVIFAEGRGITNVGYYFTIQVVILIVIRISCGKLIDKTPYQYILGPCAILCIGGLLAISFVQSFTYLIVAGVLLGFGYGFANPTAQTSVMRQVGPERYGAASATYYFGVDIALGAGGMIMGQIAETFKTTEIIDGVATLVDNYAAGFQVICIPLIIVIPMLFVLTRKKKTVQEAA